MCHTLYEVKKIQHFRWPLTRSNNLNGNDSRKLLKNVQLLEDCCPEKYGKYVEAFAAFDEVVTTCYGTDLVPDYREKISHFKSTYQKLGISTTPKVQAVFYHIIEFCEVMKMGLSPWSEQTSESVQQDFNKVWENYKVRDTKHPESSERLLQSIITYI